MRYWEEASACRKCKYLISIFLSRFHFFHRRSISVIESKMFICSSFEAVGTHLRPPSLHSPLFLQNRHLWPASPELYFATIATVAQSGGQDWQWPQYSAGGWPVLPGLGWHYWPTYQHPPLNTLTAGKDKYEIRLLFNFLKWLNQTKIIWTFTTLSSIKIIKVHFTKMIVMSIKTMI